MRSAQDPNSAPMVLIVEDEPRLRDVLHRALSSWGFVPLPARSGEEAQRIVQATPPDIALIDLNLPGIDGIELLRRLREKLPLLQGIVLTGFASLEAAREAIHLDVVEFLTKPCHLGELEKALDRALRRISPPERPPALPRESMPPLPQGATLDEVERQHILLALQRNKGNRTATAAELGISRRTLYYKLDEYAQQGFRTDDWK